MRQVHRAGEKVFIDYSGKKPRIWSSETGEAIEVELFVAVLGASNYTFAEATRTQRLEDFCASTVRALEFFGGVPKIAVPDQLRSAVSGPDRYDPEINPTYAELAQHYDLAIVPARPGKPRDKAKVEGGGAGRAAMDPGVPPQPHLLQPRRAQHRDRASWSRS